MDSGAAAGRLTRMLLHAIAEKALLFCDLAFDLFDLPDEKGLSTRAAF